MNELIFDPFTLSMYFDLKVREQCRSCKRYNFSSQCPPHLPDVEYYQSLLPTYQNGIVVYSKFNIENPYDEWKQLGAQSSLELHQYLLKRRQDLLNEGHVFVVVFTGGSCKLCTECTYPCKHPSQALIPIEGCGLNVVNFMKEFNIDITFPITKQESFYRIGLVLYD
jgi:predicted metal-binding protein